MDPTKDFEYEVMPLREANDYVQSLESRGDFKFKGIYALYNYIFEATQKFQSNRILPDINQIQRDVTLPKEKFYEYLNELFGKGSVKSVAVVAFPAVDYIAGALVNLTILCRPLQSDGNSFRKYYEFYKSRTIDALSKWLAKKESKWEGNHRDSILQNLHEAGYSNSHAGAVIYYYLQNPLDRNQEEKVITYRNFVKPIIQELINKKLLLYIKQENYSTILFVDEDSLKDRFQMLIQKLSAENSLFSFIKDFSMRDLEDYQKKISDIKGFEKSLLFNELKIVIHYLEKVLKQKEEQQIKNRVLESLTELARYDWVVNKNILKNLRDEFLNQFMSNSDVLHTEFVIMGKINQFFLHKRNIYPAVVHAKRLFEDKHDDTEAKILMQMNVDRFLEGEQLKVYKNMEEEFLFQQLPWFIRLFRLLLGRTKVKDKEKELIKENILKEETSRLIQLKQIEAEKKTRELAKQKLQKKEEVREKPEVELFEQDKEKVREFIEKDEKIEMLLDKIINILDETWDKKELPTRLTLLEKLPELQNNEDYLIQFLKKYGKGKIFSFRIIPHDPNSPKINLQDPKYQWPILISKKYIIKNGNRLLKEAMDEEDKQRNALMPEQEKFDVATSIQIFLNKILSKKN